MVDAQNMEETPAPVPGPPKPKPAIVVFLASSTGRLIVGGVLLFTVVVVAGAFLFFSLLNSAPPAAVPTAPSGSTTTTSTSVEATRPPDLPIDDTYTFRNIFAPTVRAIKIKTVSSTTTSSTDTSVTSDVPADTLVLKSIETDSGKKVANFQWNGAVYACHNGDQVDSSPWQVLTIYSDSVLMLYGDSRVTLTVGQGFSK
jgi:hypothetical protein